MEVKLTLYLLVSSADISFANNLDPDQARRNVGPGLDPKCLTLMVFLKKCFLQNISADDKKA